jgi:hypothetical protein
MELDHDRKGVPGSPDLAATIFAKIVAAAAVIADVTAVGCTPDWRDGDKMVAGKKLINSNVAIEVGYALRALTDQNVLLGFNRHYGSHEALPFDLRHKGGAITFDLPPDANKEHIAQEKKALKAQFVQALRPYLRQPAPAPAAFFETPSTFSRAAYFNRGDILARVGAHGIDEVNFAYASERLAYLRIMSQPRPEPIRMAQLNQVAQRAPLLVARPTGVLASTNEYGAIAYDPGRTPPGANGQINASTQLMPSGEVWAISATLVQQNEQQPPGPKLQPLVFERAYYDTIRRLLAFAAEMLGIGAPWQIESGVVGIRGMNIIMPSDPGWIPWGPVRTTDEVVLRRILHTDDNGAVNQLLLDFFAAVFDTSGYARPDGLFHFPPEQPRYP